MVSNLFVSLKLDKADWLKDILATISENYMIVDIDNYKF